MSKQFTRLKEDFICEVCAACVKGDGYTNHCPHCLTSKHVDINPGDRESMCGGVMYATNLEIKGGDYILTQVCKKCKHARRNKTSPKDSEKALRALSAGNLKEYIEKMKVDRG